MNIPIFEREKADGLESRILATASLRLTARANSASKPPGFNPASVKAGLTDFDLYHLSSVLASVGWNKNDDVFDASEIWQAKDSPVHKLVNYNHDESQVIGHIISSNILADGKPVPADGPVPDSFDVVVGSVLYRKWEKPDLQKRMDDLISGIARGEWFVSMECLLRNFDYAVIQPDGTSRIIARSAETAFLTKHLRIFGGTGEYQGNRIGRLLRNFTFSGKGMVQNPANERSIILPATSLSAVGKQLASTPQVTEDTPRSLTDAEIAALYARGVQTDQNIINRAAAYFGSILEK
jgi:hypothetical protein